MPSDVFGPMREVVFGEAHHAQHRNRIVILAKVGQQRSLQCGVEHFVYAEDAEERIGADLRDQLGTAADEAGLRAAEQLVATVSNDADAGAEAVGDHRFAAYADPAEVEQFATAQVFHHREVVLAA